MPRYLNCVQGSQEWMECRAGHATASRFSDILAGGARRDAYLWELVSERMAGPRRDSGGQAKEWGHESEVLARHQYSGRTGNLVQQVGFGVHSKIRWLGASSDGLILPGGGLEVKSPFNSGIHARTLAHGMPEDHYAQVQGNLWVLDLEWLDFVSYDPAFSAPHDLYIERVEPNPQYIKNLEKETKAFLAEVSVAVRDILRSTH